MTRPVALLAASLFISAVLSQPLSEIKTGFPCVPGDKCESGAKCTNLIGSWMCVPVQTYFGEREQGLFGDCSKPWLKCIRGTFDCRNGVCVPSLLPRQCNVIEEDTPFTCWEHQTCQYGYCKYGGEGESCRTPWLMRRCLPGLRCIDPNHPAGDGPAGRPGKCTRIGKGDRCLFGAECPLGMTCGTSGVCVASASWQPCTSSYVCPLDHACVAGRCRHGKAIGWAKVPTEDRAHQCKSELDCPFALENRASEPLFRCLNGVCIIEGLGAKCKIESKGPYGRSDTCGYGLVCESGKCAPGSRGRKCNEDDTGTCLDGLWCEAWGSRTCKTKFAGKMCANDYGCPAGLSCSFGKCTLGDSGSFCISHGHCKKGLYCVGKKCNTPAAAFA